METIFLINLIHVRFRGSLRGGTTLTVSVPDTWVLRDPTLLFGGQYTCNRTDTYELLSQKGMIAYTFRSLEGSEGLVTLGIFDSRYPEAPVFSLGFYGYEKPADIYSIIPATWTFGSEMDVLVYGSGFKDSPLFSCIVDNVLIPARWLSATMAVCSLLSATLLHSCPLSFGHMNLSVLPSAIALTLNALPISSSIAATRLSSIPLTVFDALKKSITSQKVEIRMSNNRADKSASSVLLNVRNRLDSVVVFPMKGFTSGGTPITVSVADDFDGQIFCGFGASELRQAFKTDSNHYTCISPISIPGPMDLRISDESLFIIHETIFEYLSIPQLLSISPSVVPSTLSSVVTFHGFHFLDVIGR